MPLGSSPLQKTKEDIFLKNNLEYEQRLKGHLYQFDGENRKHHAHSMDDSQASERNESRVAYRESSAAKES